MLFDPGESLRAALQHAQRQLEAVDAAMAQTAQASLFSEALLGAVHARLAEVKAAAK